MPSILTEISLDHTLERVWQVLVDFDHYAEWNPLNIKAKGQARLGARIPMTFLNPASPGSTIRQTVTVTTFEPGRALAWSGSIPFLFNGRHYFTLSKEASGVRLQHGEDLGGWIGNGFTPTQIARDFVPHYEAVNLALAQRLAI
ncbi:MAG: SRPBCC domain-containing protein [Alphaproteobacteria bacterium]